MSNIQPVQKKISPILRNNTSQDVIWKDFPVEVIDLKAKIR